MAEALFAMRRMGGRIIAPSPPGWARWTASFRAFIPQAMKEIGVDITKQRSRMLTAEMVKQADFILGMTHSHVDTVALLYPQAAEKTFLLREFDDTLDPF